MEAFLHLQRDNDWGDVEANGTIVISLPNNGKLVEPAAITAVRISETALGGLQADLDTTAGPSTYNVFFNRSGAF